MGNHLGVPDHSALISLSPHPSCPNSTSPYGCSWGGGPTNPDKEAARRVWVPLRTRIFDPETAPEVALTLVVSWLAVAAEPANTAD